MGSPTAPFTEEPSDTQADDQIDPDADVRDAESPRDIKVASSPRDIKVAPSPRDQVVVKAGDMDPTSQHIKNVKTLPFLLAIALLLMARLHNRP